MLKEMMNTRQAVKSVEGYNTLSRREQDKIARESGLLICWIFGPMLLLIPLYFLLPEAWFENCLGSCYIPLYCRTICWAVSGREKPPDSG